jgi:hypothetical protein
MKYDLTSYTDLENKNVFIHYDIEHYDDGCNLCFSIEFRDYDQQTYWFNDNHEFGNIEQTMRSSIELAYWFLEKPERINGFKLTLMSDKFEQFSNELLDKLETLYIKEDDKNGN